MMKNICSALFLVFSVFYSCTNNFEEINTNKNYPVEVNPENILPTAIFNIANSNVTNAYDLGEVVSQYGARYEYTNTDLYNWTPNSANWFYLWLQNITDLKNKADKEQNPNYKAIGLILESYMISVMTDSYGPIPYSQANKGILGINKPKYDSQEEIYTKIFTNLETANSIISTATVRGDIMFKGDMNKWKRFSNSLYLRLLLRVSNKINVSTKLQQIVNNPGLYPLISSNNENAIYNYSGSFPDISPVTDGNGRIYEYHIVVPTTTMLNELTSKNDTRIDVWFEPKKNIAGNWVGLMPGLPLDQIGEETDYARKKDDFFSIRSKINAVFITYSEVNFLLAEARHRNLIMINSAKFYYDLAVTASFAQWGATIPPSFLSTLAPFSETNLFTQKWLSLYHNNLEAWFDWKRTGQPSFLKAGPATRNNNLIPRKLLIPDTEQSLNSENYLQAIRSIEGNGIKENINSKVWWDKF
jgi:hypothetical protein